MTWLEILTIGACYGLGCFTSGYYWVRWRTGLDIRLYGSGNVGARNVGRITGGTGFVATLLLDICKGLLAAQLAYKLHLGPEATIAALVAVVVGHNWPAQLGFRGGKGVATSFGAFLAYDTLIAAILILMFIPCWAVLRNFTLAGLLAFTLTPLFVFLAGLGINETAAASFLAILILVTHHKNIREELMRLASAKADARMQKENS